MKSEDVFADDDAADGDCAAAHHTACDRSYGGSLGQCAKEEHPRWRHLPEGNGSRRDGSTVDGSAGSGSAGDDPLASITEQSRPARSRLVRLLQERWTSLLGPSAADKRTSGPAAVPVQWQTDVDPIITEPSRPTQSRLARLLQDRWVSLLGPAVERTSDSSSVPVKRQNDPTATGPASCPAAVAGGRSLCVGSSECSAVRERPSCIDSNVKELLAEPGGAEDDRWATGTAQTSRSSVSGDGKVSGGAVNAQWPADSRPDSADSQPDSADSQLDSADSQLESTDVAGPPAGDGSTGDDALAGVVEHGGPAQSRLMKLLQDRSTSLLIPSAAVAERREFVPVKWQTNATAAVLVPCPVVVTGARLLYVGSLECVAVTGGRPSCVGPPGCTAVTTGRPSYSDSSVKDPSAEQGAIAGDRCMLEALLTGGASSSGDGAAAWGAINTEWPADANTGSTNLQLDSTNSQPDSADMKPDSADVKPDSADAKPGSADSQPDSADSKPDSADAKPGPADSQPDPADSQPDFADAKPDSTDSQPNSADSQPDSADAQPDSADSQPDSAESKPAFAGAVGRFVCPLCEKRFVSQTQLARHAREHGAVPLLACRVCWCPFRCLASLVTHVREHSRERPVPACGVCGRLFQQGCRLRRHLKQHDGRYDCQECGDSLSSNQELRQHSLLHADTPPLVCEVCGRGFRFRKHLAKHAVCHVTERRFACCTCGKRFVTERYMKDHIRRMHLRQPVP